MRHLEDEQARTILMILFDAPYNLGPASHHLADYAAENRSWCGSFMTLMRYLMVATDAEILAIRGIGPGYLARIRAVVRAPDPWLDHAWAMVGRGD